MEEVLAVRATFFAKSLYTSVNTTLEVEGPISNRDEQAELDVRPRS